MSKRDRPGGGSPPTKKLKEKSGEVSTCISCVKCKEVAEDDSIECECGNIENALKMNTKFLVTLGLI